MLLSETIIAAPDPVVDPMLDVGELRWSECPREREVEGRVVGPDERAALDHAGSKDVAKRAIEQVGGAVIAGDPAAPFDVDPGIDGLPAVEVPRLDVHMVSARITAGDGLGVAHDRAAARPPQSPGVADLSACLRVERRDVEQHDTVVPGGEERAFAVESDAHHGGFSLQHVVPDEARRRQRLGAGEPAAPGRCLAALALLAHRRLEALEVHRRSTFACHLDR
jgi:hypothetical protein